jgi:methionyl-tRNA synthetase
VDVKGIRLEDAHWQNDGERAIEKGEALWPRIEPAAATKSQRSQMVTEVSNPNATPHSNANPNPANVQNPQNPQTSETRVSIDDFLKIDLRVAKVLAAERVPNSKKLMKLSIDVGTEQRTLVAGIAEAYEAEQLVGKTVGVVFNLKPAKLMGIESNGMILAASPEGGKPVLVAFDGDIAPGSRIR